MGWFFKMSGILWIGFVEFGFLYLFLKISPGLFDSLQFGDQKFAGFVTIITLSYLLFFLCISLAGGLFGIGLVMAGFALGHAGTISFETSPTPRIPEQTEHPVDRSLPTEAQPPAFNKANISDVKENETGRKP
jgi:hypothetical protein